MVGKSSIAVLSAGYGSVEDAGTDYDAVKAVFDERGEASSFDAAVIDLSTKGKPRLARTHEPSNQITPGTGVWGRATRVAHYLFEGLAMVGGEAGGAPGGTASAASVNTGVDAEDLQKLGATLKNATAGFVVAIPTGLIDQVRATVHGRDTYVSSAIDADLSALDHQITSAVHQTFARPDATD
jgi:uncharacterized membrane protein